MYSAAMRAQWVGQFLNPDTAQSLHAIIIANTATTITVWGDLTALGLAGATYEIKDFHLTSVSPCVETGDPQSDIAFAAVDVDGESRLMGCRVDMGPDEFRTGDSHSGDLNGDGVVGFDDLVLFVQTALQSAPLGHCVADLTGNGIQDGRDIAQFADILIGP